MDMEMDDVAASQPSHRPIDHNIKARNLLRSFITSQSKRTNTFNTPPPEPILQRQHSLNDVPVTIAPTSILFNKTWSLYKTTPFFQFNTRHCGIYQNELQAHIGANARNFTSAANTTGNLHFPGQINNDGQNIHEIVDDLGDVKKIEFQFLDLNDEERDKDAAPRDQECLLITVTVRPKGKSNDLPYYCAIFLDTLKGDDAQHHADFTYYSTIFMKAPTTIAQVVIQWLERKFDCHIRRSILQTFDLRRIVNNTIDILHGPEQEDFRGDKANRPIELTYALPVELAGLRTITVTIPADEARQLLAT
ncbi:hypothetical protein BGZ94_000792 [Podila epigama]|nr:hypothetical protein BGZ94_000792 [Podila epigama]